MNLLTGPVLMPAVSELSVLTWEEMISLQSFPANASSVQNVHFKFSQTESFITLHVRTPGAEAPLLVLMTMLSKWRLWTVGGALAKLT